MGAPNPLWRAEKGLQMLANNRKVKRLAPFESNRFKIQLESPRRVNQAVAKFAVADHKTRFLFERQLRTDDVIRQRAGTEEDFDAAGFGERAELLFRRLKFRDEQIGAVRLRRLFEGVTHFAM